MKDHITDEQRRELEQVAAQQRAAQQRKARAVDVPAIEKVIMENWRNGHDDKLRISIPTAKLWLEGCLSYFLGQNIIWLPEYDEVAEWMEHTDGRGLMCIGDCGRGKTLITQKVLPLVFQKSLGLHFPCYTALDLLESYAEISKKKVIFIDDVGTEPNQKKYGVTHDYFAELVDLCERQDKMLICSTNLLKDELLERYGLRTFDRLQAITRRVFFEGDSLRGR